ncbi:MAG: hypothetical protein OER88_11325, partial [Planctomycetota bacterium]|nr:hypothetical protein [Planctomycetota bacterium]
MSALGDLASRGYTVAWLESRDPALRTTIHNCAAKLREHDLWRFVRAEADSDVGTMHFLATDVDALKRSLGPRFTRPAASDEEWESSERCFSASLHLKHFRGWPRDKVQA